MTLLTRIKSACTGRAASINLIRKAYIILVTVMSRGEKGGKERLYAQLQSWIHEWINGQKSMCAWFGNNDDFHPTTAKARPEEKMLNKHAGRSSVCKRSSMVKTSPSRGKSAVYFAFQSSTKNSTVWATQFNELGFYSLHFYGYEDLRGNLPLKKVSGGSSRG